MRPGLGGILRSGLFRTAQLSVKELKGTGVKERIKGKELKGTGVNNNDSRPLYLPPLYLPLPLLTPYYPLYYPQEERETTER